MRIIYIHQYFNTPKMSGGTRSYEIAKRLVDSGHKVTMITSTNKNSFEKSHHVNEIDGIKVKWLRVKYDNKMNFIQRIYSFIKFVLLSTIFSFRVKADIIIATSTPLTVCIPGIILSKFKKIPMVFEVRDLWPEMPIAIGALRNRSLIYFAKKLEKFAYKNSSHIICLSPGMAEGVKNCGIPEHLITVIPNSSDISNFQNCEIKSDGNLKKILNLKDQKICLYAGSFGEVNNLEYLVKIANEVYKYDKSIIFVLVGEGKQKSNLERLAKELRINNKNFFILEPKPKNIIPSLFSSSDLILSIFTNLKPMWSNSANKFFDGLAAGKPVCINYGGWQYDLIKKYNIGLAIPPNDVSKSSEDIIKIFKNKKLYKTMSDNSLVLAKNEFDRDKLFKKFEKVLFYSLDYHQKGKSF